MSDAQSRGWGHPDSRGYFRNNIRKLGVAGITLWVHKDVLPLFEWFILDLTRDGYRLDGTADDWGYANRDIRGRPGVKSNHSWGLAIDLNATTNPMTNDGRLHTDLPPGVRDLAAKYGLTWGGAYRGRKDAMHFEFTGTPLEASRRVAQLTRTLSPPKETDERMKFTAYRKAGKDIALVAPGCFIHVDGEEWKVHCDKGLVTNPSDPITVNAREWDVLKAVAKESRM